MSSKREWLTVTEIAERLPVSYRTVINEIKGGRLPAKRFGRKWLVREADLERYMDESASAAMAELGTAEAAT